MPHFYVVSFLILKRNRKNGARSFGLFTTTTFIKNSSLSNTQDNAGNN